MKILHVLAQLPCGTGSGIYFTNLIKELGRYGHTQCAVFALQDHYDFPHLPAGRQYPVRFKTDDLPFPVPGMSDVMPYDSSRYCELNDERMGLWLRAFRKTLEQVAADFQPDLLILHHLWALTSLALEIFPKAKSIGICHHTDLRQARQNPEIRKRHVNNISLLNVILALSGSQQAEIREIHSDEGPKLVAMGGGFDSALFFPATGKRAEGPVKILYAGKIDPSKGIFALLEAFSSLRKRDPGLHLSIVGSAAPEQAGRLNERLGHIDGVRLYPSLPQEQLARTMREHDIFVLPSFFEGLGLIAIEALACGLWTVAAKIEGLVSLLGDRVVQSGVIEFVAPGDLRFGEIPQDAQLQAFIDGLEAKITRQVTRVRAGAGFPEKIYDEISKHSWKAIASRINAIISDPFIFPGMARPSPP